MASENHILYRTRKSPLATTRSRAHDESMSAITRLKLPPTQAVTRSSVWRRALKSAR